MNRDEVKEIAQAVAETVCASNVEMYKIADKMIEQGLNLAKSGAMLPGLVYSFGAEEVRSMLRANAEKLRTAAAEAEGNITALVEAAMAGAVSYRVPGAPDLGQDDLDQGLRMRCEVNVRASIIAKREQADRLDWRASHLVDKAYVLTAMDLADLRPEPFDPLENRGRVIV